MTGDHRRRLVPERLLLPPPPRDEDLRRAWDRSPFDQRRRLATASQRSTEGLTPTDAEIARAAARARVATRWRLQASALVLGWLMLMTLWGFGRSTYPASEGAWLVAGLVAGGVVWAVAARAAGRRVARARAVARHPIPPPQA